MTNDQENPNQPQKPSSILGAVDFNNVSFAYPTRPNVNVLRNFSLSIAPNQTVALVGASGAGTLCLWMDLLTCCCCVFARFNCVGI
jgi:ABC-type bacteriocin/lantibiotic exporter with double-glycine peptidase domain